MPKPIDLQKKSIRRVVESVVGEPWAIREDKLHEIAEFLEVRHQGRMITEEEIQSVLGPSGARSDDDPRIVDGVQVIDVYGTLAPRMSLMMKYSGGTSTELLERQINKANKNPDVKTIVFVIDSPGGAASYTPEVASAIRRSEKRTVAAGQNLVASGAFWIATACDEFYASESTSVGSLGVYMILTNRKEQYEKEGVRFKVMRAGKLKAAGNPYEEWTDEQLESIQKPVMDIYSNFVNSVALGRGVTAKEVEERFGQGSVFLASEAKERGMLDGVATVQDVIDSERLKLTGSSSAGNTNVEEREETMKFSTKLKSALCAAGLISSPDSDDAQCETAIRSWALAKGEKYDSLVADEDKLIKSLFDIPSGKTSEEPNPKSSLEADNAKILADERLRRRELVAKSKLIPHVTEEQVEAAIESGASVEEATSLWLEGASREEPNNRITHGPAQIDKFVDGATEVLASRSGGDYTPDPEVMRAHGSTFEHMSFLDIGREYMRHCGYTTTGVPDDDAEMLLRHGPDIMEQNGPRSDYAVNRSAQHPNLIDWLAGKILKRPYPIADVKFEQWAFRLPDCSNFDPKHFVEVGIFDHLDHLKEAEDPKTLKFSSGLDSWYKVERYANDVDLTVEMIVGDKVQGFARQLSSFAAAAPRTTNSHCISLLQQNPNLLDGVPIFHTSRGNIISAGSGGAPSASQAADMRLKHRLIKGYTNQPQGVPPTMALVPANHETAAKQTFMRGVYDSKVAETDANINTIRGEITPVIDSRLDAYSANKWWTSVDPNESPVIGYSYFRGFGRQGRRRSYFDDKNLTRHYVLEARFGVAAVGYRGMVQNAGV